MARCPTCGADRRRRAPEKLSSEEWKRFRSWARRVFGPVFSEAFLARAVQECLSYHRAKGHERVSWEATCRNWLCRKVEIHRRGPVSKDPDLAREVLYRITGRAPRPRSR